MADAPLLKIQGLNLTFGERQVIRNVSLQVAPGEMLALVGESGSGKSLSALSVLGLQPEDAAISGNITMGDDQLMFMGRQHTGTQMRMRGNHIGMIFQEPMSALNPLHVIGQQIVEAYKWHTGFTGALVQEKIAELMTRVGLSHFIDRADSTYPHQLSGGERQRLMIGMAIANNPKLLIADEPTTALDVHLQQQIMALLKTLQHEHQMGVMLITHDLTVVQKIADRVAVMKDGEIVETGSVREVFANPKHAYTRMLIDAVPSGSAPAVPNDAPQIIACEQLAVRYPIKSAILRRVKGHVEAVKPLSIYIRAGETLGIVGESGSGKSSLGNALLRLAPADGTIVFMGTPIHALRSKEIRPMRARMQLVFQDPFASLNPRMTVGEIIGEGLHVHQPELPRAEIEARVAEILAHVGLDPDMAERYPHAFSGGQRQRIAIARAMILKPSLIILDEPTSALDMSVQAQVIELLRELQASHHVAYMLISHDLRVVRAMAHYVIVLKSGEVVEEAATETLFNAPKHDYTKALMHAAFDDYL